jgi:hypothetical protein
VCKHADIFRVPLHKIASVGQSLKTRVPRTGSKVLKTAQLVPPFVQSGCGNGTKNGRYSAHGLFENLGDWFNGCLLGSLQILQPRAMHRLYIQQDYSTKPISSSTKTDFVVYLAFNKLRHRLIVVSMLRATFKLSN